MNIRIILVLITLLFISSCDNSEKEARILFNQAIKEWAAGNIRLAEEKFILIENQYLNTAVATESIKQRALLKEQYKRDFDAKKSMHPYKDIYSKKVIASINNHFSVNNSYPESLAGLSMNEDKYLSLCKYEKAFFEYGYNLNCSKAEIAYEEDIKKEREAKIKLLAEKRALQLSRSEPQNNIKELTDYPRANTTWGVALNKPINMPEIDSFNAYYFNTNEPQKVIYKEAVNDISINYSWDDFHGIKSEDFGGYWVGQFYLEQDEIKTIAVNQSRSKTRLIIDGYVVYEGGSNFELPINLKKGSHLIEVEYVNNWHTTEFSVSILDTTPKLSYSEIKNKLSASIKKPYQVHYAGLYESSNKDLTTVLNIKQSEEPIVLFLGSYSTVKWIISNPFKTKIYAIVYGSYSPGSTVSGDLNQSTLILLSKKSIGSYKSSYKCTCVGGHSHCEGGSMLSTKRALEDLTKQKMAGFSGKYSASQLAVPEKVVDAAFVKEQELYDEEASSVRSACTRKNNPDFEKMF